MWTSDAHFQYLDQLVIAEGGRGHFNKGALGDNLTNWLIAN